MISLNNTRQVCWDLSLADRAENITLDIHRPVRQNIALDCGCEWEAFGVNYLGLVKTGDGYRLYYRARDSHFLSTYRNRFCIAESADGITFTRMNLDSSEYENSNIHFTESRTVDNFSVFRDENPDCPDDARFKALSSLTTWLPDGGMKNELLYYRSADGIRFEKVGVLPIPGVFDSYNIVFWDSGAGEYRMYIRDFHTHDGERVTKPPREEDLPKVCRDVRLTTSPDFIHWTEPEMIRFSDGDLHTELYTGMIFPYYRADVYLGLPTRYNNRPDAGVNFKYLPDWNGKRQEYIRSGSRLGTVFCDTGIMTSRDGLHFEKWNGAYMTTGPERGDNWYYEDGYFAYGIAETPDGFGGCEISLYRPEGWFVGHPRIVRYTVRLDGFYSWHANGSGGSILTHPVVFRGSSMEINFATSSLGGVRILLCDEDGCPMEGYDSGILFGDSTARPVEFEKPADALNGVPVRIRFELTDADLYSFRFV